MSNPLSGLGYPNAAIRIYANPTQERKARALIENFPQILTKGYKRGSTKFCDKVLTIIKQAIRSGMPPKGSGVSWPALSSKYVKRYGSHGIYLLTGQYLREIKLQVSKNGYKVYIGFTRQLAKRDKNDKNKGLTLTQVANILEFGSSTGSIPPRPLWRPAYESAGGSKKLKKSIVREIQAEVRKYT